MNDEDEKDGDKNKIPFEQNAGCTVGELLEQLVYHLDLISVVSAASIR